MPSTPTTEDSELEIFMDGIRYTRMTSHTNQSKQLPSELDEILNAQWKVYYDNAKLTSLADTYFIAKEEAKAAITAWKNNAIVEELEKLAALPNVYPEKLNGQYTHVYAIFQSALTERIAELKDKQ